MSEACAGICEYFWACNGQSEDIIWSMQSQENHVTENCFPRVCEYAETAGCTRTLLIGSNL